LESFLEFSREITHLSSSLKVEINDVSRELIGIIAGIKYRDKLRILNQQLTNVLNHGTWLLPQRSGKFRQLTTNRLTINISETRIKCIFGRE